MRHIYPSDIGLEKFEKIRPLLENARKKMKPRKLDLYELFCGVLKKWLSVVNATKRVSKMVQLLRLLQEME